MKDFEAHEDVRPFLTTDELRAMHIDEVKKGGLDPMAVAEVINRSVVTIDTLLTVIDNMRNERMELIAAQDAAGNPSLQATRMLEAAAKSANEMIELARQDAVQIIADGRAKRDEIDEEIRSLAAELDGHRDANAGRLAEITDEHNAQVAELQAVLGAWRDALDPRLAFPPQRLRALRSVVAGDG